MSKAFTLFVETFRSWYNDNSLKEGAALSFYTIISLPPLIVGLVSGGSFFLDKVEVQEKILSFSALAFGSRGNDVVQDLLQNIPPTTTLTLATLISFLLFLLSATAIFEHLQTTLNAMWRIAPKENQGIATLLKNRIFLFFIFLILGFCFTLSTFFESILIVGSNFLLDIFSLPISTLLPMSSIVNFFLLTFIVLILFKFLPSAKARWSDLALGSVLTALLFTFGKYLLSLYITKADVGSGYGAAGSIVVLLVWIYYSSQTFFIGAEFTRHYAHLYGEKIKPNKNAVKSDSLWYRIFHKN